MIMRSKIFSIHKIRKYLKKKSFTITKNKQESDIQNISRTFLSSLIIISIFFITPLVINFTKKKNDFI